MSSSTKTLIGLIILVLLLGGALAYVMYFGDNAAIQNEYSNQISNPGGSNRKAVNVIANRTYDYTHSVQEEKKDYNQLEQDLDSYHN